LPEISLPDYLAKVLGDLERQYRALSSTFPAPKMVDLGALVAPRYAKQSDPLLCFLKGVKLISTLNGALALMRAGYAQEMNVLIRVADDCCADILFMLLPRDGQQPDTQQEKFFSDFFQEEFSDHTDVLGSRQKRDMVSRKQIHSSFAQLAKDFVNPSDVQTASGVIHGVFSGYVHGAYPQIMELYGDAGFYMSGMAGTIRQQEAAEYLTTQMHRAIMMSELVAKKLGGLDVASATRQVLDEFEQVLGRTSSGDPAEMMRKAKKKTQPL
jgi:hypothetical protein